MAVQSPIPPPVAALPQIHQYQLVRSLGAGGMGVVYEAFHLRLKRRVALKLLSPQFATSPEAIDRFGREMAAIGQLSHPHIVQAIDAGVDGTFHYLVMEYVEGANVEAICRRAGPLQLHDACEITRQTALALAHAHSFGIVHRDIKPSNLLLSVAGQIKLADLGLARFHSPSDQAPLTAVGDILGTYDYMSPEQAAGAEVGPPSDVYSLGATLFRLLAGAPLFSGSRYPSPVEKMHAHMCDSPPRLSSLRTGIPSHLDELLQRLLKKQPSDRPRSLHEVIDILAPLSQHASLPSLFVPDAPAPAVDVTTKVMQSGETQKTRLPRTRRSATAAIWLSSITAMALTGSLVVWTLENRSRPDLPSNPVTAPASTATSLTIPQFQDRPTNQLELLSWHPFLNLAPKPVVWPEDGLSAFTLDAPRSKLTATCADFGVLAFGRIDLPAYRLHMDLYQNRWNGDMGVFLGLRQHPEIAGALVAQGFQFFSSESSENGPRLFLRRMQLVLTSLPNKDFRITFLKKHDAQIDRPAGYPEPIELQISPAGLLHIRWRGADIPALCTPEINRDFAAHDYLGPFGVFLSESDLTVSRVELMPITR